MRVLYIVPFSLAGNRSGCQIAALETVRSIQELCELHLLLPEPAASEKCDLGLLRHAASNAVLHFYRQPAGGWTRMQRYRAGTASALIGGSYLARTWTAAVPGGLGQRARELAGGGRFDVVHCEWLPTIAAAGRLPCPTLVRTLDVHYAGLAEWLAGGPDIGAVQRWFWRSEIPRLRRFEIGLLGAADRAATVSAEDEDLLRHDGVEEICVIPPPMPIRCDVADDHRPRNARRALFVGRLDLPVNSKALFVFADEIWPKLRAKCRERLEVVFAGGKPDEEVLRRGSRAGIEVRPSPSSAEMRKLFNQADVLLCPLSGGTGIKIKTLEAMAYGKAVVGYQNAFRGIPAEHNCHALIAHSAEEFANLLESAVSDGSLRRRLGKAARELVGSHFNPATLGVRLIEAYATVQSRPAAMGTPAAREPMPLSTSGRDAQGRPNGEAVHA